ncbi:CI-like repressor protein [Variovorax phage VarioGold]|uniref:S24 family peptidase n=1 Tax=Variovorax sp. ZS18.2.2 TaxID=2971255 RepID=UPI0021519508|nr:S24 family peptidase [Variovorax sp. ZS18.2.2]MCR6477545.1 S24 family peptidase [Variovorax sp. ZS18.2.2]UYD72092.1 CI-like repressor protein [Variovorax phage VarioGold]
MDMDDLTLWRRERLQALAQKLGGNAALGRRLGYKDGAFVGQMIKGVRPITEKTIAAVHEMHEARDWFSKSVSGGEVMELDTHPDLEPVRVVRLRLQAGVNGFAVEPDETEAAPIFFRSDWLRRRGLKSYNLVAVRVSGQSMETTLFHDDVVVANTADTEPKDGEVYAVNFEGEPVVKRLIRESGTWWLSSDNQDQRRYPKKECRGDSCLIVGRIVHRQSERI